MIWALFCCSGLESTKDCRWLDLVLRLESCSYSMRKTYLGSCGGRACRDFATVVQFGLIVLGAADVLRGGFEAGS